MDYKHPILRKMKETYDRSWRIHRDWAISTNPDYPDILNELSANIKLVSGYRSEMEQATDVNNHDREIYVTFIDVSREEMEIWYNAVKEEADRKAH